jgi:arylsulfatase A-like enzyme
MHYSVMIRILAVLAFLLASSPVALACSLFPTSLPQPVGVVDTRVAPTEAPVVAVASQAQDPTVTIASPAQDPALFIGAPAGVAKAGAPNVLIITIDTARADHFGIFGNAQIKTPVIDSLARQGARFHNTYSQFSQTNPSHASIFTGTYPAIHKLMHHGVDKVSTDLPTLAETLSWAGYNTAGIYSWPLFDPGWSGLEAGFKHYQGTYANLFPEETDPFRYRNGRADLTTNAVVSWLRNRSSGAFFLWVHYQDPHYPYTPPPPFDTMYVPADCGSCPDGSWKTIDNIKNKYPYTDKEIATIVARYDGAISFTDREIGRIIEELKRTGDLANTIIVLLADHGEAFNENGRWFHPYVLYNTAIHIPLIVVYPPAIPADTKVDSVVRTIDVMPSVLELAGVPIPRQVEGKSLMPLVTGTESGDQRTAVTQVLDNVTISMVRKNWKIIRDHRTGDIELYNLSGDPKENNNLVNDEPSIVASLVSELDAWMASHGVRP